MAWTQFWDMHSGGDLKEPPYDRIYIETPEEEAKRVFFARFGHNPSRVSCTCCGDDYSVTESETFEQAAGYHMNWNFNKKAKKYEEKPDKSKYASGPFYSLEEYQKKPSVLIIKAEDIKPSEIQTEVPAQGYVWVD